MTTVAIVHEARINRAIEQALDIVGHPAMVGIGPIGGKVFESELTIASADFVSCDAVGSFLLGKGNVRHIVLGQEHGMGVADLAAIEIKGVPLGKAKEIFNAAQNRTQ